MDLTNVQTAGQLALLVRDLKKNTAARRGLAKIRRELLTRLQETPADQTGALVLSATFTPAEVEALDQLLRLWKLLRALGL